MGCVDYNTGAFPAQLEEGTRPGRTRRLRSNQREGQGESRSMIAEEGGGL